MATLLPTLFFLSRGNGFFPVRCELFLGRSFSPGSFSLRGGIFRRHYVFSRIFFFLEGALGFFLEVKWRYFFLSAVRGFHLFS